MNPVPHRIPAAANATNARFFEDVLSDLLDGWFWTAEGKQSELGAVPAGKFNAQAAGRLECFKHLVARL
jgi:hypothetical protein